MDTRFNYRDYDTDDVITVAEIKDLVKIVKTAGTGWIQSLIALVKLIVIGIFYFIIWRKMEHQKEIVKQKYFNDELHQSRDDDEQDDQDLEPR